MLTENEDTKIGRGNTLIKVFPPIGREKSINSGYTSMNEEVKGIEFRRPAKTSPILERYLAAYRTEVPFVKDDIVMYKEIHKTVAFLNRTRSEY